MQSTTGGQHSFAQIPSADIQRSSFDRSCGLKTTFDAGYLVPIFVDEALPGDTMAMRMSIFSRLATPLHPVMDNIFLDFHFFSVPMRLVWDNWQKFNGEQVDPGDSTDFLVPQMVAPSPGHADSSLSDYFGIPTYIGNITHSSLWHRAYNLIYNEWFRDENLVDSVVVDKDDGPDNYQDYVPLKRGKRHDYFTSCLPWPQKGPSVELPLGVSAPVALDVQSIDATSKGDGTPDWTVGGNVRSLRAQGATNADWSSSTGTSSAVWNDPKLETVLDGATGIADLSAATAATINQIRQAFQIQRLYERDARGGTRYTEVIRSHFGVVSPDQRLQRPEFLGGGTTMMMINPVAQTSATASQPSAQGNLAGFGVASANGIGFTKSFVEHCLLVGMVSARADLNYQQGLPRMFSRSTRWDFYWPALANLGEQAVLSKEIYIDDDAADEDVFGYQERFAEYRYKPSQITGAMRSNALAPLDTWHLAQDFSTRPLLNEAFIAEAPPIARIVAVPSEPDFIFDAYFQYKCARPMPTYSVPGMIDHF